MSSETHSLPELIDLAIKTPEFGAVNFNILKEVLHKMVSECKLQNVTTEWKVTESSTKVRDLHKEKKYKPERILDDLYSMRVPVEKKSVVKEDSHVSKKETGAQASTLTGEKTIQTSKENRPDTTPVKDLIDTPTQTDKSEEAIFQTKSKLSDESKSSKKLPVAIQEESDASVVPKKSETIKEALFPHKSLEEPPKVSSVGRDSFSLKKSHEESQKGIYLSKEALFRRETSDDSQENTESEKGPSFSNKESELTAEGSKVREDSVLLKKPPKQIPEDSQVNKIPMEIPKRSEKSTEKLISKVIPEKISEKSELSEEQQISKEIPEKILKKSDLGEEQEICKKISKQIPKKYELSEEQQISKEITENITKKSKQSEEQISNETSDEITKISEISNEEPFSKEPAEEVRDKTKSSEFSKDTSMWPAIKNLISENKILLLWENKKISKRVEALEEKMKSITHTVDDLEEWKQSKFKRFEQIDGQQLEIDYSGPTVGREEFEDTVEELGEILGLIRITQKELKENYNKQRQDMTNEMLLRPKQEEINKNKEEFDEKFSSLSKAIENIENIIKDTIFPESSGTSKCISCKRKARLPFSGRVLPPNTKTNFVESNKRNMKNINVIRPIKQQDDLRYTKECLKRLTEEDDAQKIIDETIPCNFKPDEKDKLSSPKGIYITHLKNVSDLEKEFSRLRGSSIPRLPAVNLFEISYLTNFPPLRQDSLHLPSIRPKTAPTAKAAGLSQ